MIIVVKSDAVGTFNWEIPSFVEKEFEKMISIGEELGWSSEDIDQAQQGVIQYLQNTIHPLLCLLGSSVMSGPLFGRQADTIREGIGRITLEIGANLHEFDELDSGPFRD